MENEKTIFESFMQNPTWRNYYEKAPSDNCKQYIKHGFMTELYQDNPNEFKRKRNELGNLLNRMDWEYLYRKEKNGRERLYYAEKLKQSTDK